MKRIIYVKFKQHNLSGYNSMEYAYNYDLEDEIDVGDIVLVDTKYGKSLAEVSDITGKIKSEIVGIKLKDILQIITSAKVEEEKRIAKAQRDAAISNLVKSLVVNTKRNSLIEKAENNSELIKLIKDLTDEELLEI